MANYLFNLPAELRQLIYHFVILSTIKTSKSKKYTNKWLIGSKTQHKQLRILSTNMVSLYYTVPYDSFYKLDPMGFIPPPHRLIEVLVVYDPWRSIKTNCDVVLKPHVFLIRDGAALNTFSQ